MSVPAYFGQSQFLLTDGRRTIVLLVIGLPFSLDPKFEGSDAGHFAAFVE